METRSREALQQAIDHFGGVGGLAEALGVERQAVYMWKGKVPELRAYQIESLTNGKIKATDLIAQNSKRNGKAEACV